MPIRLSTLTLLPALVFATGLTACSDSENAERSVSTLTISGHIDAASFGGAPSGVQVSRGGVLTVEAPIGADGSFAVVLPKGTGYQIAFAHADGVSALVFPRQLGTLDQRFDVTGSGAFDLGIVRRIGDPANHQFLFSSPHTALKSDDGAGGDDDDLECEDGVDARTGAVCVDDDDDELAGMCGGENDGHDDGEDANDGENDANDSDDLECEDGIDAATGAMCVDDDHQDEGDHHGEGDHNGEIPNDAAVADHNLPIALGCADEEDDEEED
jgi:hypothetical protein